jgi:hypothetical protein
MQMQFAPQAQQTQQFIPPFSAWPRFSNGFGMTSLIFGAIGLILPWYFFLFTIPYTSSLSWLGWRLFFNVIVLLPSLAGIIFGRIGMQRARKLHPTLLPDFKNARNGLILGVVALSLYFLISLLTYIMIFRIVSGI